MSSTPAHSAAEQRVIADPGFAGDTGAADAELRAALAAWDGSGRGADYLAALARLATARLLVPVVAVLGESEVNEQGLVHDKSADMAAVLMQGADGRQALLAFTGLDSLTTWNPQARPVPVMASQAARAALDEDAAAIVVDIAGPARMVVEDDDLAALAAGHRLVRVGEQWGWLDH